MCLIIRCDKELPISKPLMEHWCEKNGDGWGMMWIKDNTIQVHRSMEKVDFLWEKYQELRSYNPIIHLRWRTHGDTDLANCHPFYCGNGIFLMHNGVIGDANSYDKTKSDTWHFIEDWVKGFFSLVKNPHQVMRSKVFKAIFEKAIGSNNRIILGDRGGFVFFNEAAWHTVDNEHTQVKGLLVSNTYAWDSFNYGKPKPTYVAPSYNYGSKWNPNHDFTSKPTAYYNAASIAHQTQPIKHIDGKYRNSLGEQLAHIVGNIYVDALNQSWVWIQGLFQRCPEIDRNIQKKIKKEMRKNKGLIPIESPQQNLLLVAPTPQTIIVVNDPGTDDEVAEACVLLNKEEYNDILVKQWQNETPAAIHTLVYSEPEDAATVLCRLMGKV